MARIGVAVRDTWQELGVRVDALRRPARHGVAGPILVHQMGKVASTSVVDTLRARRLGVPVHHSHELVDELRAGGSRGWHRRLRRHLERGRPDRPWHVITLVREPVARNLSAYFHNLTKPGHPAYLASFAAGRRATTSELLDHFLAHADHDFALDWFDRELRDLFGVDVYAQPFPHDTGFAVHHGARVGVAVLRVESLQAAFTPAMEALLGVPGLALATSNESPRKVYRSFVSEVRLPGDYLDRMYGSRLARHFYTPGELARFRARWSG